MTTCQDVGQPKSTGLDTNLPRGKGSREATCLRIVGSQVTNFLSNAGVTSLFLHHGNLPASRQKDQVDVACLSDWACSPKPVGLRLLSGANLGKVLRTRR